LNDTLFDPDCDGGFVRFASNSKCCIQDIPNFVNETFWKIPCPKEKCNTGSSTEFFSKPLLKNIDII